MNIYIVPLQFSNKTLLNSILNKLCDLFYPQVELAGLEIDYKNAYSSERGQYYSTQIIANSIEITTSQDGKVLILTDFDLYIPALTFVFGEAQLKGKHSIVSVCRLHEEFYTGESNEELLLQRSIKEILHELGHTYGLKHCLDWDCVMHSSLGIEEVDVKGNRYCKNCARSVEGYKII